MEPVLSGTGKKNIFLEKLESRESSSADLPKVMCKTGQKLLPIRYNF